MNKKILKDVLTKKWARLIIVPLLIAFLVGQAAMFARSNTLKGVRYLDTKMITSFVQAAFSNRGNQTTTQELDEAFQVLKRNGNKDAYLGIAVWVNDKQVVSNHSLLDEESSSDIRKNIADGDIRYSIEKVNIEDPSQKVELAFFRPEMKHNMNPLNFIFLSFQQLADPHSHEVTFKKFLDKLWILWLLTGSGTLLVMCSSRYISYTKIQRIERDLEQAHEESIRLEELIEEAGEQKNLADKQKNLADEKLSNAEKSLQELKTEFDATTELLDDAEKTQSERLERQKERNVHNNKRTARIQEAEYLFKLAKEEADQAKKEAKQANQNASTLYGELTVANQKIHALESQGAGAIPKNRAKQDWATILTEIFPNFEFKKTSFNTIRDIAVHSKYKHDLALIIKYLARLHNDRDKTNSKVIHGGGRSREIRLSGAGRGGNPLRIYFCDLGKNTFVMIGLKTNQDNDFEYLRKKFK